MKKIMFSAVALVAFSFTGMASNGEVKELITEEVKTEEVSEQIIEKPTTVCMIVAVLEMVNLRNLGIDEATAGQIGLEVFNSCMGGEGFAN